MAIKYRLYQNNNKSNETAYGKWYARAVHEDTVDIDDLADQIEANVSVKRSDVLGVIAELIEVMTLALQAGHKVKLNRFGTFKIGLTSRGVENIDDYNASSDITGMHVLFQPAYTLNADKTRVQTFISGAKAKELTVYDPSGDSDDSSSSDDTSSDTTDDNEDEI